MSHLHHMVVRGEGASPEKLCVLVHGILGAGMNLRTVARRIQQQHPDYWFLLPDLRGHGSSPEMAAPHSVQACAEDLFSLEASLGVRARIRIGHSFGGKVVLAMGRKTSIPTVVMDALPWKADPKDPGREWMNGLLTQLEEVPVPLGSRNDLGRHLGVYGGRASFEGWMGTNLRADGEGGFRWRFNLKVIRALIEDYWQTNLAPPHDKAQDVHILYGEKSERFTSAALKDLRGLIGPRLHCIDNAGHWLHVDNQADTVATLCDIIGSL